MFISLASKMDFETEPSKPSLQPFLLTLEDLYKETNYNHKEPEKRRGLLAQINPNPLMWDPLLAFFLQCLEASGF